jgi:hypothetical protein
MSVNDDRLPAVAGNRLPCSLQEFERRCLVHLMWEQEKPLPDNGLIALLCDGVRLAREQADFLKGRAEDLVRAVDS